MSGNLSEIRRTMKLTLPFNISSWAETSMPGGAETDACSLSSAVVAEASGGGREEAGIIQATKASIVRQLGAVGLRSWPNNSAESLLSSHSQFLASFLCTLASVATSGRIRLLSMRACPFLSPRCRILQCTPISRVSSPRSAICNRTELNHHLLFLEPTDF
jgi:hypothetical protein